MKKYFLALCLMLATVLSANSKGASNLPADEGKKWLMVKIYEHQVNDFECAITVTYPEGKCERTALLASKAKNYEINDKQTAKVMGDLFSKGYKITYSDHFSSGDLRITTFFMEIN